jgi:hypothetical protein
VSRSACGSRVREGKAGARSREIPRAAAGTALGIALSVLVVAVPLRAQPTIDAIEPLGTFTTNAIQWGRDGGYSALVGGEILWLFGDTFTPHGMRSATAAWSTPGAPLRLREEIDASWEPLQLYPFSTEELAFERAHTDPPDCCRRWRECPSNAPYCRCPRETDCNVRIALWPGSVFEIAPGRAMSFYEKVVVGVAPYDFTHVGTGLARIEEGSTVATRLAEADGEPTLVFADPEPNFLRATLAGERTKPAGRRCAVLARLFGTAHTPDTAPTHLYVYATRNRRGCAVDVVVSRVPSMRAAERSAYRFWDGDGWVPELDRARPILTGIAGGLGSVGWNDHLRGYLAVFSDVCTGGSKLQVRSAPRPEGPWSEAAVVDLAPLGATADSYAGLWHPSLGRGRQITVTYYVPDPEAIGRLHLARLRLGAGEGD